MLLKVTVMEIDFINEINVLSFNLMNLIPFILGKTSLTLNEQTVRLCFKSNKTLQQEGNGENI